MVTPFIFLNGIGTADINTASLLSSNLESNLIEFFNYGLLNAGGFGNVTISTSGGYGGDMSRLSCVFDPNFQNGQCWQAERQDWVWESGLAFNTQPIQVSGVTINGTFYPLNTVGPYSHYVNYPLGRIVFNNPLPTNSVIQASYSYRIYPFTSADDSQWFREIQFQSLRVDDTQFLQQGSGVWNVLAQNRVQLPVVVVEVTPKTTITGYELGGTTRTHKEVRYHIYTETSFDRNKLVDVVTLQKDKTIPMFDENLLATFSDFPLDENGSLTATAKTFPDLVAPQPSGYFWKQGTFLNMNSNETISTPPLYQAVIINTFEVIQILN